MKKVEQKNKDENRKFFIAGEICGKIGVISTGITIISMTIGTICMMIWDAREKKNFKNNKK